MELVRVNEGKELVVSLDDISRVSGVNMRVLEDY